MQYVVELIDPCGGHLWAPNTEEKVKHADPLPLLVHVDSFNQPCLGGDRLLRFRMDAGPLR